MAASLILFARETGTSTGAIGFSWALIGLGAFAVFVQKGLKFGIDFSGGTAIAVRLADRPELISPSAV